MHTNTTLKLTQTGTSQPRPQKSSVRVVPLNRSERERRLKRKC